MAEATRLLDGLGGGFNENRLDRFLAAEAAIDGGAFVGNIGRGSGGSSALGGAGSRAGDAWQQAEAAAAELECMQAEPLWANWGGHGDSAHDVGSVAARPGDGNARRVLPGAAQGRGRGQLGDRDGSTRAGRRAVSQSTMAAAYGGSKRATAAGRLGRRRPGKEGRV